MGPHRGESLAALLVLAFMAGASGCAHHGAPGGGAAKSSSSPPGVATVWTPARTATRHHTEEYSLGAPAAAFDPAVGTVLAWPHTHDLEVQVKPVGQDWHEMHVLVGDPGDFTQGAMVGIDGDGVTTLAWVKMSGDQAADYPISVVTATRSADGVWSKPAVMWQRPSLDNMDQEPLRDPHLAVGRNGSAVLAWTEEGLRDPGDEESGFSQPWASYRPSGGDWQKPVMIGVRGDGSGDDLTETVDDAAVDPEGTGIVVVSGENLRTLCSTGGAWESDGEFFGATGELEVSSDGDRDMVFQTFGPNAVQAVHAVDGDWSPPELLTPGGSARPTESEGVYYKNPSVTVHGDSATVLLASSRGPVQAITRRPDGNYSEPITIAPALPRRASSQDVVGVWSNESGQALAVWGPDGQWDGVWELQAAYRGGSEDSWRAPVALSQGKSVGGDQVRDYDGVSVVVYPNGSVLAVWSTTQSIVTREFGRIP